MKKIIFILFLLLSIFSCYIIYTYTNKKDKTCLVIGDTYINPTNLNCNNIYVDNNLYIKDLYNQIYYNINPNNKLNIHQLLNKTDILIISIGKNDLNQRINKSTKDIYTYLNNRLTQLELTYKLINKYEYDNIIIINYQYPKDNKDIYVYTNYKLKQLSNKYNYKYLDLNIKNNQNINEIISKMFQ